MSQQQTQRNLCVNKFSQFEQTFTRHTNIFFLNTEVFIILKNTQYLQTPSKPKKYFNLNSLQVELKHNKYLYLKDLQFEEYLTHQNINKLNEFVMAIENNRRNIIIQNLFPKRFLELNQRLNQKLLQQFNQ